MAKTPPPRAVVRIEGKPIEGKDLSATEARDMLNSLKSKNQTAVNASRALACQLAEFWDRGGPKAMNWGSAEAVIAAILPGFSSRQRLYQMIAYGRAVTHLPKVSTTGRHFSSLPERTLRPVIEVAGDDPEAMLTVLEEAWSLACNDPKGQRAAQGSKKQPPRMTSGHTRRAVEAIYGRQGASESEAALTGEISRRARDWREFSKMIDKCLQIAQFHGGHEALMERLDWCSNFAQERLT